MAEGVLGADVGHASLEIDVEEVVEVFGGAVVAVIDDAEGAFSLRAALDLSEVEVAEREDGEGLEEHARALLEGEDDAGLELAVRARDDGLARQHEEARHVVQVVLDAVHENLQPVNLRCASARHRAHVEQVVRRDELRRARRVVHRLPRHAQLRQRLLALRQRLRVAYHALQLPRLHPRHGHQTMMHPELHLSRPIFVTNFNVTLETILLNLHNANSGCTLDILMEDFLAWNTRLLVSGFQNLK